MTLKNPLDCNQIQPVGFRVASLDPTSLSERKSVLNVHWKDWCWSWNSNTLVTWCKEQTHLKRPDVGKDWGQEEKGTMEDEMVGWHHRHNGHGFGWTLGVGDGQGGLACCSSWGRRVGHDWATEQQCDVWFHNSPRVKWSLVELHTDATEDLTVKTL